MDELIRDITKAGFMPKSEARRRIGILLAVARASEQERIVRVIEDYFRNIVLIPDPWATKKNLVKKIRHEV